MSLPWREVLSGFGLGWKGLPGINALAYFSSLSVKKKEVLQL
jgi:hypothetical protein